MRRAGLSLLAAALFAVALHAAPATAQLTLRSSAFDHHGDIPTRNSAYAENLSPELSWTGAPAGTRSFAIILDDPDAPTPEPFVHWVIYNIPGDARGLPEGLPRDANLSEPAGARNGQNGVRQTGYFGPRPPAGPAHAYNFRLLALSIEPDLPEGLNKQSLLEAVEGSILAETTLTGMYQAE